MVASALRALSNERNLENFVKIGIIARDSHLVKKELAIQKPWGQAWQQMDPIDFKAFVQSAGDAIVAAGTDGSILLWNRAAERIFGYTEQEALGHSLDLIIPERLRVRHWDGYRRVMETGNTRYGTEVLRVPAVHKDGRRLSIAFTVALLLSPNQKVQAIVAIIRDETSRWEEERALRQRLAELEKDKVARDDPKPDSRR